MNLKHLNNLTIRLACGFRIVCYLIPTLAL